MSTTEHYGKSTTVSLPATVLSTTVGIGPYKGPCRYRGALGTSRPTTTAKARRPAPKPWPPKELALPDTIEAIVAGRANQQELLPDPIDDSREGRLTRLLGEPSMRGKRL